MFYLKISINLCKISIFRSNFQLYALSFYFFLPFGSIKNKKDAAAIWAKTSVKLWENFNFRFFLNFLGLGFASEIPYQNQPFLRGKYKNFKIKN